MIGGVVRICYHGVMSSEFFILLVLLAAGFTGLFWLLARRNNAGEGLHTDIKMKFAGLEGMLKQISEESPRSIADLRRDVDLKMKESRETLESSSKTLHDQSIYFTKSITEMHGLLTGLRESVKTSVDRMSGFEELFRAPKLRGTWGESSLESLLQDRYPSELILRQHHFRNGEAVDFALKLPNNRVLPIDAKYPQDTFTGIVNAATEGEKEIKRKELAQTVKKEIDDISQKYIRPEENTTNFAMMFLPAEAVYYEIMINMRELNIGTFAWSKHVILTSPNTLYLHLGILEHWWRDTSVARDIQDVIKRLNTVIIDAKKLDEGFERLGKHLRDAQGSYDDSRKRLGLLTERVDRVIKIGEEKVLLDSGGEMK